MSRRWLLLLLILGVLACGASSALAECTPSFLRTIGNSSSGPGVLREPRDIAVDSEGNAWVADTVHNRVQKFNSSGEYVAQFSVGGEPQSIDLDAGGDVWVVLDTQVREYSAGGGLKLSFGSFGTGNGQFHWAHGIAVDSATGSVYVLDRGFGVLARVQQFNSKGEYLDQFGKVGAGNGEFKLPEAIAVDSEGNVLVADTGNNRVQEFTPGGEYVRKYGTEGSGAGQFTGPAGIAVDSEGKVWVSDTGNYRVQRFSAKGAYLSQFGSSGGANGQFSEPRGIFVSESNLWVVDAYYNNRVQKFSFGGEFVSKFGISATTPGYLSRPRDVASDSGSNVWVADTGNSRVQQFNSIGEHVTDFSAVPLVNGVDPDAEGDIWVASATELAEYEGNGEWLQGIAMLGGNDVAIDPSGSVWVVEGFFSRVRKFNSKGELLSQFGKEGTGNGEFKNPQAIAIDSEGNVLVADTGNNRYQEFNSAGEFVRKVGSEGTGNGQFKSPGGIAADSEGRVWVSDTGNNRIQRFSAKGAYLSQFGSGGSGNGQFSGPRGIDISGSSIWIADTGNDRVQQLSCL